MMYTVFSSRGLIPVEAFTHFGVNAKPNTRNPIGFFGTGLKYAIAVLVRHQIPVTIWIGNHKYIFTATEEDFRGKEFTFITLKRAKGTFFTKTSLPFTTELGKNWALWQAFRELFANTLDEGGDCFVFSDDAIPHGPDETVIIVQSEEFAQIANNRDKYFLPGAETKYKYTDSIQVFKKSADAIYYRSMRVWELPKEYPTSLYTYNIIAPMELTEDRTLKATYMADYYIKNLIVTSEDEDFIENVLAASKDTYEGHLDYDSLDTLPSDTFKKVFRRLHTKFIGAPSHALEAPNKGYVYSRMSSYMDRVAPEQPPEHLLSPKALLEHLRTLIDQKQWYDLERFLKLNGQTTVKVLRQAERALDAEAFEHDAEEERKEEDVQF